MFSWGNGGKGVPLLVSKLLVDIDYPQDIIEKIKCDVAQKIWNRYELEIRKLKVNLKKTFYTDICPAAMEEDQQDFVNRYIKRSFIPLMVEILADMMAYIDTHPLILKFRTDSVITYIATLDKHSFSGSRFSISRSTVALPTLSASTKTHSEGSNNNSSSLMLCEVHLDSAVDSISNISESNYTNSIIAELNGNDIKHTNSYPNYCQIKPDDKQKQELLVEHDPSGLKIKTIKLFNYTAPHEPRLENHRNKQDSIIFVK